MLDFVILGAQTNIPRRLYPGERASERQSCRLFMAKLKPPVIQGSPVGTFRFLITCALVCVRRGFESAYTSIEMRFQTGLMALAGLIIPHVVSFRDDPSQVDSAGIDLAPKWSPLVNLLPRFRDEHGAWCHLEPAVKSLRVLKCALGLLTHRHTSTGGGYQTKSLPLLMHERPL